MRNIHGTEMLVLKEQGWANANQEITVLDYFAAAALQGFAANHTLRFEDLEEVGERAYHVAHLMMKARVKA